MLNPQESTGSGHTISISRKECWRGAFDDRTSSPIGPLTLPRVQWTGEEMLLSNHLAPRPSGGAFLTRDLKRVRGI